MGTQRRKNCGLARLCHLWVTLGKLMTLSDTQFPSLSNAGCCPADGEAPSRRVTPLAPGGGVRRVLNGQSCRRGRGPPRGVARSRGTGYRPYPTHSLPGAEEPSPPAPGGRENLGADSRSGFWAECSWREEENPGRIWDRSGPRGPQPLPGPALPAGGRGCDAGLG